MPEISRIESPLESSWSGFHRDTNEYRRILLALFFGGIGTFAQLYSPQGILPLVASSLNVTADQSALLISAATLGLAVGVVPWSKFADKIGRLPAMKLSLIAASVFGFAVVLFPSFSGMLVMRFFEGAALGGLPALAVTYLQEEIHPLHTAVAAGTYVSGTTIGGLLGRVVSAPIAAWLGWRAGVATVVVLAALATLAFLLLAPAARGFRLNPAVPRFSTLRLVATHLRSPGMLALFAQGFFLMGGFVTIYNFLAFRLQGAPFGLNTSATSLLFLAYLAGTWSSRRAGQTVSHFGRQRVLLASIAIMIMGVLLTLAPALPVIMLGLVVMTIGFFGAHSIASGWTGARATVGRAQATSLYTLFYYLGSSIFGWLGGMIFSKAGWGWTAVSVTLLCLMAAAAAARVTGPNGSAEQSNGAGAAAR